jgi:penicillin amidase
LQLTNTRDYLGYDLFDKLYTNQQDSLDPIIPKGTEFATASLHPLAPANVDMAYLHKTDSTVSVNMYLKPQQRQIKTMVVITGQYLELKQNLEDLFYVVIRIWG